MVFQTPQELMKFRYLVLLLATCLLAAGEWLGLLQQDPEAWFQGGSADIDTARIDQLLADRDSARKSKDFARSDAIRKELTDMGVVIEDTPQGARWKLG